MGSRSFRIKARLGNTFDKNIYFRYNIYMNSASVRAPSAVNHTVQSYCQSDKIYPFFIGHASYDMNVTYASMDPYGNLLYAGWSRMAPYGWNNNTQQGYIAMMDQKGKPYWIYMIKDNTNTLSNICTFIKYQQTTIDSVDYVFAMCNVLRFDLADASTNYKESPMILKMKHDTGQVIFMRHLPVDSANNVMA